MGRELWCAFRSNWIACQFEESESHPPSESGPPSLGLFPMGLLLVACEDYARMQLSQTDVSWLQFSPVLRASHFAGEAAGTAGTSIGLLVSTCAASICLSTYAYECLVCTYTFTKQVVKKIIMLILKGSHSIL